MTPEQEARSEIDRLLAAAGWSVQPRDQANITAAQGVAVCEYPLKKGHGFADYLLYVDGAAVGVIEAKKTGIPLTAVESLEPEARSRSVLRTPATYDDLSRLPSETLFGKPLF